MSETNNKTNGEELAKKTEQELKKQEGEKKQQSDTKETREEVQKTHKLLKRLREQIEEKVKTEVIQASAKEVLNSLNASEQAEPALLETLGTPQQRADIRRLLNDLLSSDSASDGQELVKIIGSLNSEKGFFAVLQTGSVEGVESAIRGPLVKFFASDKMTETLTKMKLTPEKAADFLFTFFRPVVAARAASFGIGTALESAFAAQRELGKNLYQNNLVRAERARQGQGKTEAEKKAINAKTVEELVGPEVYKRWNEQYEAWLKNSSTLRQGNRRAPLPPMPTFDTARQSLSQQAEQKTKAERLIGGLSFGAEGKVTVDTSASSLRVGTDSLEFRKSGPDFKLKINGTDKSVTVADGITLTALTLRAPAAGTNAGEVQLCINNETAGAKISDIVRDLQANSAKTTLRFKSPPTSVEVTD